ncbi:endocuticle structural glycoprotein SgAbd-8 [Drosophila ficusphila]|uniref:endocuticle structural glycoprotein SgAbd-8 n=1 Tax=Drosophila ficusphila TaxID=30025 RepID=UPI0007E73E32|nr:endocuticle structural glycoprotein SgAbd-8 [Drosophila ficusphila]
MLRPLLTVAVLLFGLSSIVLAGRLSQRYLPAPQASKLHYHGVSGQGHARPGAGHAIGGAGSGFQRQQQPQIPIVRSDYQSDANGNYNFGFDTGNGIHRDETGEFRGGWPHGSLGVQGSYSYTGDDGKQYTVNYTADKNGFHAEGAHLPVSPSVPAAPAGRSSYGAGGYRGSSHIAAPAPATRYLPPGYRQRRHY